MKRSFLKHSIIVTALTGSVSASAYTGTCTLTFDAYSSLSALPDKAGYVMAPAPWYQQACDGSSYKLDEEASGAQGHYFLYYESSCVTSVNCDNNSFGLPASCAPTGVCTAIDAAAYPRYVGPMSPTQTLRATLQPAPNNGQYCIDNGAGGQVCTSVSGRFFSPRSIVVKAGSQAKITGTYVFTVGVSTPGGMRYTTAKTKTVWELTAGTHNLAASDNSTKYEKLAVASLDAAGARFDSLKIAR